MVYFGKKGIGCWMLSLATNNEKIYQNIHKKKTVKLFN